MNVCIITTVNHNVGDDFVREGILYLLKRQEGPFTTLLIHKHLPVTARPEWEWFHHRGLAALLDRLPWGRGLFWSKVIDTLPLSRKTDKVLTSDLLVQSGAPVYWSTAHVSEWFGPLVRKRYLQIAERVPFINIGAGTCQQYGSDGSELIDNPPLADFIRELHRLCKVTTLRDRLSRTVLNGIGLDAPVIPCPSIFGRDHLGISLQPPEYVAMNFMGLGGHYEFGQQIDRTRWRRTFADFVASLRRDVPVLLVCHNKTEYQEAGRALPGIPRFLGASARDYLECYARARYFIGCRVHGAFATASFGRPAFVIGSDSRARMMEEIGLTSVFVNETSVDTLMAARDGLERQRTTYPDVMSAIKELASAAYRDALAPLRGCEHNAETEL